MVEIVESLPHKRLGPVYPAQLISWLLMAWQYKEPGHHQPWYCIDLGILNILGSSQEGLNVCSTWVKKLYQIQSYIYIYIHNYMHTYIYINGHWVLKFLYILKILFIWHIKSFKLLVYVIYKNVCISGVLCNTHGSRAWISNYIPHLWDVITYPCPRCMLCFLQVLIYVFTFLHFGQLQILVVLHILLQDHSLYNYPINFSGSSAVRLYITNGEIVFPKLLFACNSGFLYVKLGPLSTLWV